MKEDKPHTLAWRRSRPRPGPPRTGWILVVTTVAVVIFMGITLWTVSTYRLGGVKDPADTEAVFQLLTTLQERYPQAPGPPQRYRAEADAALRDGHWKVAEERLGMALALAPDDVDALLQLAILAGRRPPPEILDDDVLDGVIEAVGRTRPSHRLLPAARAWRRLRADDPNSALTVIGEGPATLAAHQARLEALSRLDRPTLEAAQAVLALDPGDRAACTVAGRQLGVAGRPWQASEVLERCLRIREGEGSPSWHRLLGRLNDQLGDKEGALAAYGAGGFMLHAGQIRLQDGEAPGQGFAAALAEAPGPVRAQQGAWAALLMGDLSEGEQLLAALEEVEGAGAELRLVKAALRLALGLTTDGLRELEDLDGPEAHVLRGRASWEAGDTEAAWAFSDLALAQQPWNPAIYRLRASWAADSGDAAISEVMSTMESVDPWEWAAHGGWRDRDVPWEVLVPEPWPEMDAQQQARLAALLAPEPKERLVPSGLEGTAALDFIAGELAADPRRWGLAREGASMAAASP